MAARAVHVDEVNPEKSAPLGGDARGIKKWKPLIYKGFRVVVTVGLEPTVSLRFARSVKFAIDVQPPWSGVCTCCSLRFRLASSATGGARLRAPIDVNDVLSLCSMFAAKTTRYSILLNKNRNTSTRQKSICGSSEPFTSTATKNNVSLFFDYSFIRPAPAFQALPTCSPET